MSKQSKSLRYFDELRSGEDDTSSLQAPQTAEAKSCSLERERAFVQGYSLTARLYLLGQSYCGIVPELNKTGSSLGLFKSSQFGRRTKILSQTHFKAAKTVEIPLLCVRRSGVGDKLWRM